MFFRSQIAFFFKPHANFAHLIHSNTFSKPLNAEFDSQNYQDHLWFTKLKQNVLNSLEMSSLKGAEMEIYNKALIKIKKIEKIAKLSSMDIIQIMIFLGVSSHRRFHFLQAQNTFTCIATEFSQRNNYKQNLEIYRESDFFTRKLLPNLILSMSNLRVIDRRILQSFSVFFSKFKKEIFKDYFYTVHTILSLNWAIINFSDYAFSGLIDDLNEYLWTHREKLDSIGILRFLWMKSYTEILNSEILEVFFEKWHKLNDFVFNYKNSTNILQIFINLYPEVAKDFYSSELKFSDLNKKIIENQNKNQRFFEEFYKIALTAKIVAKVNITNQFFMIDSFKNDVPSYTFTKRKHNNQGTRFENNICKELDILKVPYKRNSRLGIYEIDLLLENDKFSIEINGDIHNIYDMETQRYKTRAKSLAYKMRHLNLWGVERFATINFTTWRNVEYSQQKRKEFIKKIIENPEQIKPF